MKQGIRDIIVIVAVLLSAIGGIYVGHTDAVNELRAPQAAAQCATGSIPRNCYKIITNKGGTMIEWYDATGASWFGSTIPQPHI